MKYPLHFFDYEAYGTAIPELDGTKPFEQVPFQVSIHTLSEEGILTHFEYLANTLEYPKRMLQQMQQHTGTVGTFVSWHASYEKGANDRMTRWLPPFEDYLDYINGHILIWRKSFKAIISTLGLRDPLPLKKYYRF